jgi:hypothetical protein
VGISARPQAEVHALEVLFLHVLRERDVQLHLDPRIRGAVPLGETEEGPVRGVIAQGIRQFVVFGEVGPGSVEPLEESGVVGIEQDIWVDPHRVGAPFPEQVDQVPATDLEGDVEGRPGLKVDIVAVRQEQEGQRVLPRLQCDLERSRRSPATRACRDVKLERPPGLDPLLDLVHTTLAAEAVEVIKVTRSRGPQACRRTSGRLRVRSRVDQFGRHDGSLRLVRTSGRYRGRRRLSMASQHLLLGPLPAQWSPCIPASPRDGLGWTAE